MKTLIKLYELLIIVFIFLYPLNSNAQPDPKVVENISKELKNLKDLRNARPPDQDKIKELAKKIIHMIDTAYHIKAPDANGEPDYDATSDECKKANVNGHSEQNGKKVDAHLCPRCFDQSPGRIASTKVHEMIGHGSQAAADNWYTDPKWSDIQEIEAIRRQLADSTNHGLSKEEIQERLDKLKEYYDGLDAANQARVDKNDYVKPASKHETSKVSYTPGVYVAGKVLSEDRMAVTVVNANNVSGVVVKAEVNGKTVETKTDNEGHAIINFAKIAGGLAMATTAIIKIFDAGGNVIDQKTTTVEPGTPMVINHPNIETLPSNLQNRSLVTIPGNNLGAEATLMIGNQPQQTMSAANHELTVACNARTGSMPAYVITPNGVSQSQTVNIYDLNFSISKTTVSSGQHISGQLQYTSLPEGTNMVFTNQTPGIIKVNIRGATSNGNQTIFHITQTNGTIPVEVIGLNSGAFRIAADPQFH